LVTAAVTDPVIDLVSQKYTMKIQTLLITV